MTEESISINLFMPTSTFLYIFSRKIKSRPILKLLGRDIFLSVIRWVHVQKIIKICPVDFSWAEMG